MPQRSLKPPAQIRGVAALLGDDEPEPTQELSLTQIELPSSQPRKYFDPEKMAQLVDSVREKGILEPLLVRPKTNGNYELVAGERRYRAAKTLNLESVPVAIRELSDNEVLEVALIENLQREDLNSVEETEGVLQLIALKLGVAIAEVKSLLYRFINETKSTNNVISKEELTRVEAILIPLGINWKSFTINRLPVLNLPEDVLEAVRQGLEYTKARAIARVKDDQQRQELLNQAVDSGWSLNQIREAIAPTTTADLEKPQTLKGRITETFRLVRAAKLDDQKQRKLEKYLDQIKALLQD